jgi:hypothetical protein
MEIDLKQRYQTMLTLWFALLASVGMYFVLLTMMGPPVASESGTPSSSILIVVFTAAGMVLVLGSFVVKAKLLAQSVETQSVAAVQIAMMVACAMCEVSAILGVVARFAFNTGRESFWLVLLGAAGIALHFPRRSQLEAASFKGEDLWK